MCVGLDASTSRMDRMGCCCRISRRISCAFCATWEPNRYWRRRGSGKTTTRSQSDDATSKRKGGAGGYDCIPKVAVWVPLDTVLDVFLVRASPADAKPIASRGLLSPDFRSGSAASTGQWARSAGNGLEMGWNLPWWGPCSPDGQAWASANGERERAAEFLNFARMRLRNARRNRTTTILRWPSHQRADARSHPVGHPDLSTAFMEGLLNAAVTKWKKNGDGNQIQRGVDSRSRTHVPRGNDRAIQPWP